MRTHVNTYTLQRILLNLICWFGGICSLWGQSAQGDLRPVASVPQAFEYNRSTMSGHCCNTTDASDTDGTVLTDGAVPLSADSLHAETTTNAQEDGFAVDTAALIHLNDSLLRQVELPKPRFVPNPQRAMWLALVFPGAGQIYNRKYWKIPIVYGGFLGCVYALSWNNQMYRDYSQAYLDIMDNDPNTKSYEGMLPLGYSIEGREDRFKDIFKRKKNFYRRYRDMSIFCMVAVYALSVIDAYVDAELSSFDISKDLSMKIEPTIFNCDRIQANRSATVGVQCKLNF